MIYVSSTNRSYPVTFGSLFYANLAAFPGTGKLGVIYIANDTNKIYKWDGTSYVEISTGVTDHTQLSNIGTRTHEQLEIDIAGKENVGVASGLVTAHEDALDPHPGYATDADLITHVSDGSNPHAVTKAQVGLGNVDNTSDINKPVSTAMQASLDTKQETLVSGTNLKTINNESLLGAGNITISGSGVSDTFETISKNLSASDAAFNFTSGLLTSIVYGNGWTKSFTYNVGVLQQMQLTDGVNTLTKTFTYTSGVLTNIAYI